MVSLGCAKNLVDSEYLARQLTLNGFQVEFGSNDKEDIVIINTCGFIHDAKQESINTILEYTEKKNQQEIRGIYVIGCLSQRYRDVLKAEIPEVDGFYGVYEQQELLKELNANYFNVNRNQRILATANHYAYLKIADGCNRKCAFCSIPLIKGRYKSQPLIEVEEEAAYLAQLGVLELNLIAQDLTYYGYDLHGKSQLTNLVTQLSRLGKFHWIRLLYTYPSGISTKLLQIIAQDPVVCKYIDLPFQHISDHVLKNMRRGFSAKQTYELIELIYKLIPDVTLRTTFIVGHPGETEDDFKKLLRFVESTRFDRLGVFIYSEEEGTYSALSYKDEIPEKVKQERADEIMRMQQDISYQKNMDRVGSKRHVLIDRQDKHYFYGRTEADAPEVDNEVLISRNQETMLEVGRFYTVKIIDAEAYDLFGEVMV
jgi:ribosomal protein S12 methylthiotransferase